MLLVRILTTAERGCHACHGAQRSAGMPADVTGHLRPKRNLPKESSAGMPARKKSVCGTGMAPTLGSWPKWTGRGARPNRRRPAAPAAGPINAPAHKGNRPAGRKRCQTGSAPTARPTRRRPAAPAGMRLLFDAGGEELLQAGELVAKLGGALELEGARRLLHLLLDIREGDHQLIERA